MKEKASETRPPKPGWRLYVRCLGGIVLGVVLAAGLSLALSVYADFEAPEAAGPRPEITAVPFPEDGDALRAAAARLLAPEEVEPASGP